LDIDEEYLIDLGEQKMNTVERSLKKQSNGVKLWSIILFVSAFLIFSPAFADRYITFGATMAAAFVGLVMLIVSIVMIRVYNNRKNLVLSLFDKHSLIDTWECVDRYNENKGLPIEAYFSVKGVFFAGNPYPLKSYECTIIGAELIEDKGTALSIIYTVPNSRNGSRRHKSVLNIPVPEGKEASAKNIADCYCNLK
jgi:hypothetical protein